MPKGGLGISPFFLHISIASSTTVEGKVRKIHYYIVDNLTDAERNVVRDK
jgi:hypothetical protein